MKKNSTILFFVLSLAVVFVAAGSVVFRIAEAGISGRNEAAKEFGELGGILAPVRSAADLERPELRTRLAAYYRSSPNVLLVSVYERGSGVRWRIPADSPYLPASQNATPMPIPSYPAQSAILFAASLPADVSGKLAVDALYVSLPQNAVFSAFRDAALLIAAWLVLGGLVMFALSLGKGRGKTEASAPPEEDIDAMSAASEGPGGRPSESSMDDETMGGNDLEDGGFEYGSLGESGGEAKLEVPVMLEDEFAVPELAENPLEAMEAEKVMTPEPEPELPESESCCEERPGGLYSPLSGLGWESYLNDRLDSELARSAGFEQDLSLLFIAYEGLSPEKDEYKIISSAVSEFFSFKDLAFERGPDGFAVILPNVDADHAIRMAEEFLKKLTFIVQKDKPLSYIPVFMGLSSRAGRLVDSERMSQEAVSALGKAKEERDSHIIAFRPDPDRYRIYLASKAL